MKPFDSFDGFVITAIVLFSTGHPVGATVALGIVVLAFVGKSE